MRFSSSAVIGSIVGAALMGVSLLLAPPGSAATAPVAGARQVTAPAPRTPRGLPSSIEPLAGYVGQVSCDPYVRRGTRELAQLLARTYRNYSATSWASTYACGTDGSQSEHYDGRAIDWMVSVQNARQHAAAKAFLAWLLGSDKAGDRFAMARRLGVMYVIYDNRMWGSWDGRWEEYNGCSKLRGSAYANSCHRTHMHISLSWDGARGRTSFWTKRVHDRTDYGPCRASGLNWAPGYSGLNPQPCPSVPPARAGRHASARKRALVEYSGVALRRGFTGPAVTAVQNGLRIAATGTYDRHTVRAVRRFQRQHHRARTGRMNVPTWRSLLAAVR